MRGLLPLLALLLLLPAALAQGPPGSAPALASRGAEGPGPAATQAPAPSQANLHFAQAFEGISYASSLLKTAPPDVQLAVGPLHVAEMVNLQLSVWLKDGTPLMARDLYSFFGAPRWHHIGDPQLAFDAGAGRWYASAFDFTSSAVLFAISSSSDPTSAWRVYALPAPPGTAPDQPMLGFSDGQVVLSANLFSLPSLSSFLGAYVWVLNKADLLSGTSVRYAALGPYAEFFSLHPTRPRGPSTFAYMACVMYCGGTLALFRVQGVPPAPVSLARLDVGIRSAQAPPDAPQRGTDKLLHTGDFRPQAAILSGNALWLTFNEACTPPGDVQPRSCFRLVKADLSALVAPIDFTVHAGPGLYLFYPALALDGRSNLYMAFGYSSSSSYPSLGAAGLAPFEDPSSLLASLSAIRQGSGPEQTVCGFLVPPNVCRYGDYFGASDDPSDPSSVWLAGEYGTPQGWATFISRASMVIPKVSLTLSYIVPNGPEPPSPPLLTYVSDGMTIKAPLSRVPTTYRADYGTPWSVTPSLYSPGGLERWATHQPANGTALQPLTMAFSFYHQYLVTFAHASSDGSAFGPPLVTFSSFGLASSMPSSAGGVMAWADARSGYSFEAVMAGGQGERWYAPNASGYITGPLLYKALYYHQYLLTISYSVSGGGAPPPPSLSYISLGLSSTLTLSERPAQVWADAGSPYSFPATLQALTQNERWQANAANMGLLAGPLELAITYHHQYLVSFGYVIIGGHSGSSPPTVSLFSLGRPLQLPLSSSGPVPAWADAGSTYSYPQLLPGSAGRERWYAPQPQGQITMPGTIAPAYYHQYYVFVRAEPEAGGQVSPQSGWYNASQALQLSASAQQGWRFQGWRGEGPGAFSGPSSSALVRVSAPLNETALFYPGLAISITGPGYVDYSYGAGSGTITGAQTLYVPPGSAIELRARPSSFLYAFRGWSGAVNATSSSISLVVSSPQALGAAFSYNIPALAAMAGGLAALSALAAYALRRAKARRGTEGRA
ncbi:MAG: hypothetical protein C4339_01295 [Nitrososphaerota archaeon]